MTRLELAVEQVVFARNYTLSLRDQTPVAEWFRMPAAGVSHVAWQVDHLALWRVRRVQPQDGELISEAHQGLFGYDSVPDPDPARYPSPADIRAVFDRVHEQVLRESRGLGEGAADQPVLHPHPFAKTKREAILWCAHHEMLHAGQIGLLRRPLGQPPLR